MRMDLFLWMLPFLEYLGAMYCSMLAFWVEGDRYICRKLIILKFQKNLVFETSLTLKSTFNRAVSKGITFWSLKHSSTADSELIGGPLIVILSLPYCYKESSCLED